MRPTRTSLAPFAAALAIAALASPATTAVAQPTTAPHQDLRSPDTRDAAEGRTTASDTARTVQDLRSPDTRGAAGGPSTAHVAAPAIEITRATGFEWGDAAIGAGGSTGLLAISLGGAMALRRRHSDPQSRAAIG
jgi:hypothetical protein